MILYVTPAQARLISEALLSHRTSVEYDMEMDDDARRVKCKSCTDLAKYISSKI